MLKGWIGWVLAACEEWSITEGSVDDGCTVCVVRAGLGLVDAAVAVLDEDHIERRWWRLMVDVEGDA